VQALGSGAPVRHISAARPRDAYHGPAVTAMLESLRAAAQAHAINADRHDRTDRDRAPVATTQERQAPAASVRADHRSHLARDQLELALLLAQGPQVDALAPGVCVA
jgi:hypothetical protein